MKVTPDAVEPVPVAITKEQLSQIPVNAKVIPVDGEIEKPGGVRYLVLILTMTCLSFMMSNVICFNFTVLCMPGTHESLELSENHTHYTGYTRKEKTWLFSAVAVGAMFGLFPVIIGISTYGLRKVFFAAGMLTSVTTFLIPVMATMDFNLFLLMRFLQGIAYAACMPAVGAITSSWASMTQQGLFIAALTTFGQLSSIFSMPVAGELCISPLGWKSVYFLHAGISLVVFLAWFAVFTDSPKDNRFVQTMELIEIQKGKSTSATSKTPDPTPYLEILTTPSIWGVWIGALGDLIAVQLIHIYSPVYLHDIGGYSVEKTGFAAAVPVLFQFLMKMFAGHSSDRITGISETTKLRIYNSIALGASAVFLVALGFVKEGQGMTGLILMTLATAMFGFNGGGFTKCAALVSRQYSHFVMANVQFLLCLSMLLCPLLVSYLLRDGTLAEWRLVFFVHAAILVICNAVFCLLATAKPAPWTDRTLKPSASRNTPLYTLKV
uniref:MFS domain-containing protein n=1 Tax=Caenorhabditis tropicalis TaxID=1561998 RepID=A0A1I7TUU5_9PELO